MRAAGPALRDVVRRKAGSKYGWTTCDAPLHTAHSTYPPPGIHGKNRDTCHAHWIRRVANVSVTPFKALHTLSNNAPSFNSMRTPSHPSRTSFLEQGQAERSSQGSSRSPKPVSDRGEEYCPPRKITVNRDGPLFPPLHHTPTWAATLQPLPTIHTPSPLRIHTEPGTRSLWAKRVFVACEHIAKKRVL